MKSKDEKLIKKIEDAKSYEDDFAEIPPTDIVAFNELRSCADLFRMYLTKQLDIQPDFQREIVWDNADQTRFIDSVVKQLPIPSMCISLDFKTNKRQVIDGLQRMQSIINFLSEKEWKLSSLNDIEPKISGKTNSYIKLKLSDFYDKVENLTIPVTILRCDYTKESHTNYLFTIFHRLNSGGSKLNNQEIRNCIYNGSLNTLLKECVKYNNFQKLMSIKPDRTYRFAFQELVLRFFTFSENHKKYNGKLGKFMNDYMFENRELDNANISKKRILFKKTIDLISTHLPERKEFPTLSKTVIEGLLIGISKNLDYLERLTPTQFSKLYKKFRSSKEFSFESLKEGLSVKEKVITRINFSIKVFSGK